MENNGVQENDDTKIHLFSLLSDSSIKLMIKIVSSNLATNYFERRIWAEKELQAFHLNATHSQCAMQ